MSSKPLVGVISDHRVRGEVSWHTVEELYLTALARVAAVVPVAIPVLESGLDFDALLETLDGLLLTGSRSDIEPHHYAESSIDAEAVRDEKRDSVALPLVVGALERGVPCLAICRGCQEVNVALGGSLHQDLELAGFSGHRDAEATALDDRYAPRHEIEIVEGSLLRELSYSPRVSVNSLHRQGIDKLADGARSVAHAPDGLVEAFTIPSTKAFNLAVQWHPEWRTDEHPLYRAIFCAFAEACKSGMVAS